MGKKKRSRFFRYFAKAVIPVVIDITVDVLRQMADDTEETDIDDQFVEVLAQNKDKITLQIMEEL